MEERRFIGENKLHALMVIMRKFLTTGVSETAACGLIPPAWEFQSEVWAYERKSLVSEAEYESTGAPYKSCDAKMCETFHLAFYLETF